MYQAFLERLGAMATQDLQGLRDSMVKHPSLELPGRRAKSDLKVFQGVQL